jgi:hypothetical protein
MKDWRCFSDEKHRQSFMGYGTEAGTSWMTR